MRIVHLVDSFSPLSETFIYDYVTELEHRGLDGHVVTLRRDNVEERPFRNVRIVSLPSRWHPGRIWERTRQALSLNTVDETITKLYRRRLCNTLKNLSPDVVHAHFGPMGVLVAPVADALRIPLIVSFHGSDAFRLPLEDIWRVRYQELFQQMEAATVVSKVMREQIISLGAPAKKVTIIHVGKRLKDYTYHEPVRRVVNWVSVGRITEKKGFDTCIEAFAIATKGTNALLKIIGEGELLDDLRKDVAERGLTTRIHFLGPVQHNKVKEIMSQSDAFILCSKTAANGDKEGIPTVLMEAQALGLPCISTWHSGIPEVIPEINHRLLAEEGNIKAIAERIVTLSNYTVQQLTYISVAGRLKIEQEFNLGTEAEKLLDIYRDQGTSR